jgi:hypothetical protein
MAGCDYTHILAVVGRFMGVQTAGKMHDFPVSDNATYQARVARARTKVLSQGAVSVMRPRYLFAKLHCQGLRQILRVLLPALGRQAHRRRGS